MEWKSGEWRVFLSNLASIEIEELPSKRKRSYKPLYWGIGSFVAATFLTYFAVSIPKNAIIREQRGLIVSASSEHANSVLKQGALEIRCGELSANNAALGKDRDYWKSSDAQKAKDLSDSHAESAKLTRFLSERTQEVERLQTQKEQERQELEKRIEAMRKDLEQTGALALRKELDALTQAHTALVEELKAYRADHPHTKKEYDDLEAKGRQDAAAITGLAERNSNMRARLEAEIALRKQKESDCERASANLQKEQAESKKYKENHPYTKKEQEDLLEKSKQDAALIASLNEHNRSLQSKLQDEAELRKKAESDGANASLDSKKKVEELLAESSKSKEELKKIQEERPYTKKEYETLLEQIKQDKQIIAGLNEKILGITRHKFENSIVFQVDSDGLRYDFFYFDITYDRVHPPLKKLYDACSNAEEMNFIGPKRVGRYITRDLMQLYDVWGTLGRAYTGSLKQDCDMVWVKTEKIASNNVKYCLIVCKGSTQESVDISEQDIKDFIVEAMSKGIDKK